MPDNGRIQEVTGGKEGNFSGVIIAEYKLPGKVQGFFSHLKSHNFSFKKRTYSLLNL